MRPERAVILFSSLWLLCSVLTYVHPIFIEPTGDGFTRGLNRLGAALGWQAAASLFALLAFVTGVGKLSSKLLLKWISRIPGIIQLLLILFMIGLIVYLRVSKPAPVSEPPPKPRPIQYPNKLKAIQTAIRGFFVVDSSKAISTPRTVAVLGGWRLTNPFGKY
ncbi:MAG TPA: hypothetical protein DIV79_16560 [Opitutae bacterium]|nr:hypothetical protein [Opitutaceae bacterium]HCR31617.1 hypothetical protein [Opitutae bacterium]